MAGTAGTAGTADEVRLCGWGGGPRVRARVLRPRHTRELVAAVAGGEAPMIVRGMGRSYGDAAQLSGGTVIDGRRRARISLDATCGVVWAQAGATLGQILAQAAPRGWVLPVLPGTQHVTVGGAIACDVHGKNHAVAGAFGRHVIAMGLLTADGSVRELSRETGRELFDATAGGLGLTGVILWARIALSPLAPGSVLSVDTDRVAGLGAAFATLDGGAGAHRVAWLDLMGGDPARESVLGVRGVVTRAEIVSGDHGSGRGPWGGGPATVRARARVPRGWPGRLLDPRLVRAHNELRWRAGARRTRGRQEPLGDHLFPLDALDAWPRLYGRDGLVQYQFAVPRGAEGVLERVVERVRRSGVPCYLAVLKVLGAAGPSPLSFAVAGWTLALDFPRAAPGLDALLGGLDLLVAEAGGRVYFAKDGRLPAEMARAMYPRLDEWRAVRDAVDPERRWQSDLGRRAGLVSP